MFGIASKLFYWVNDRLPIVNTFERHLSKHPVPSKVNFWYLFGALAAVTLIIQIVTGIWLIMPYSNTEEQAFSSIEYIMRDVDYGWVIRYMHTTVEMVHRNDVENVIKLIYNTVLNIKSGEDFSYFK